MQLTIKEYVNGDYEKYIQSLTKENMCELFIDNFGGWSDEVSKNKFFEILKNGFIKLFFLQNKFAGYVSYCSEKNDDKSYLINDIHIVRQFQRKGYGTQILDFIINEAIVAKKERLKVLVFEKNPSVKFYEKNGFKVIQLLKKSNTYVMVKNILLD